MLKQLQNLFEKEKYDEVGALYRQSFNINFSDAELRLIAIALFRQNIFNNCLLVLKKLSIDYIYSDHLLCEIYAHCCLKKGDFEQAYNLLDKALQLKPGLIQARQRHLILRVRKGLLVSENELQECFRNAVGLKNKNWLRELAYAYYGLGYYREANSCIDLILEWGGDLDLLDRLAYTPMERPKIHEKLFSPCCYFKEQYIEKGNNHLVVILSPDHNFAFKGYKFDESFDLLYVADTTYSWYCFILREVTELIVAKFKNKQYKKISLLGGSKAASGALIVYQELIKHLPIPINCISFSPQVDLYPYNSNLIIPTYLTLSTYFHIHPIAKHMMSKLSQPKHIKKRKGDVVTVIYGNGFAMDKIEAQKIPLSSGVEVIELPFSGHSTSIPYTIPEGRSYEQLQKFYAGLVNLDDQDFQALGGGQTVDLIDEIWALYQNPEIELNKLLKR